MLPKAVKKQDSDGEKQKPVPLGKISSFHSNLAQAFIDQEDTDCSFELLCVSTSNTWKVIGAHKVVLAAASPVFKVMFYGSLKDSMPIRVQDTHFEVFQWLLWIIYKQKIVPLPAKLGLIPFYGIDLYKTAHKYLCTQSLMEIRRIVFTRIKSTHSEACTWFEMSQLYDDKELLECSEEIISKHMSSVLESAEFLKMRPQNVALIYNFEPLCINDEYELVEGLEKYLAVNKTIDMSNQYVKQAKKCIRFLLLTKKQIFETSILTSEEKAGILYCYDGTEDQVTMKKLELSMERLYRLGANIPVGVRNTPRKRLRARRQVNQC